MQGEGESVHRILRKTPEKMGHLVLAARKPQKEESALRVAGIWKANVGPQVAGT